MLNSKLDSDIVSKLSFQILKEIFKYERTIFVCTSPLMSKCRTFKLVDDFDIDDLASCSCAVVSFICFTKQCSRKKRPNVRWHCHHCLCLKHILLPFFCSLPYYFAFFSCCCCLSCCLYDNFVRAFFKGLRPTYMLKTFL